MLVAKRDIIDKLQTDILRMQGFKPANTDHDNTGLHFMKSAFPNGIFPTGCIHEFLTTDKENASASEGFIAALLSGLTGNQGSTVWITASSNNTKVFPPALRMFGLDPERFIFIQARNEKDILWIMDEALKCSKLSAVIGEVQKISFMESRRLQLAVEQSKVTGFVLPKSHNVGTTACVSRWKIEPVPGATVDDLPGIGYPKWNVKLLRMRNGRSGEWNIEWNEGRFVPEMKSSIAIQHELQQKAG
jgi:protein ImuA